jgi:histone chaperone ASF1
MADSVIQSVQLLELELQTPNPAPFTEGYQWRVRLQTLDELPLPIDIAFTWVGSKNSEDHDQELDEIEVGPLPVGTHEFQVEHDAPDHELIPKEDLINVTGLFMTFSYAGQQFLRVGYYVSVAFWNDAFNATPPPTVEIQEVGRNVLIQKPILNCFGIDWTRTAPAAAESDEDHDGSPIAAA